MDIILASQSPRRRELLLRMGLSDFQVIPAEGEERAEEGLPPSRLVEELSRHKAAEVSARAGTEQLVIAADTVVALDDRVLGKPRDEDEAREMLKSLSGREHRVYTGVTVRRGDTALTEHETTRVRFRPLGAGEIEGYLRTGESMDKAGAYGIQGRGCVLVSGIEGDYFNVMGLPVCRLARMLRQFGVDVLRA